MREFDSILFQGNSQPDSSEGRILRLYTLFREALSLSSGLQQICGELDDEDKKFQHQLHDIVADIVMALTGEELVLRSSDPVGEAAITLWKYGWQEEHKRPLFLALQESGLVSRSLNEATNEPCKRMVPPTEKERAKRLLQDSAGHGRVICSECMRIILTCKCMDCGFNCKYMICDNCTAEKEAKCPS